MVDNPVEDADKHDALQIMHGVIVAQHPTSIGVLVQVLASVLVVASDWLVETSGRHAGYPFLAVPLLQNPELLLRLKTKVTTEPTETMLKSTGVPPSHDATQSNDFTTWTLPIYTTTPSVRYLLLKKDLV
jgi:hypothetical protein